MTIMCLLQNNTEISIIRVRSSSNVDFYNSRELYPIPKARTDFN